MPYGARAVLNAGSKRAIAAAAAAIVPDGATVFISIGTTPAFVAAALAGREALTVITNNLNAAMAVSENSSHRVILPGGEMRLPDRDFLNQQAIDLFSAYRADFGIYGVGGIDVDGSLLDFHEEEVRMRQEFERNARQTVLVADKTKFGRRAAAVGGTIDEADRVIIDQRPGGPYAELLAGVAGDLFVTSEQELGA